MGGVGGGGEASSKDVDVDLGGERSAGRSSTKAGKRGDFGRVSRLAPLPPCRIGRVLNSDGVMDREREREREMERDEEVDGGHWTLARRENPLMLSSVFVDVFVCGLGHRCCGPVKTMLEQRT